MKRLMTLAVALIALAIAPGSALAVNYVQLCDVSGSMGPDQKSRAAGGAGLYVSLLSPLDAVGHIGSFPRAGNNDPVVKWQGARTANKALLLGYVASACNRPGGGPTPLHRAVKEACQDLSTLDKPRRVLVYTDGGNTDPDNPHLADMNEACAAVDSVDFIYIDDQPTQPAVNGDTASDVDAQRATLEENGYNVVVATTMMDVHTAVRKIANAQGVPSLSLVGMATFALLLVGIGTFFVLRRRTSTA